METRKIFNKDKKNQITPDFHKLKSEGLSERKGRLVLVKCIVSVIWITQLVDMRPMMPMIMRNRTEFQIQKKLNSPLVFFLDENSPTRSFLEMKQTGRRIDAKDVQKCLDHSVFIMRTDVIKFASTISAKTAMVRKWKQLASKAITNPREMMMMMLKMVLVILWHIGGCS